MAARRAQPQGVGRRPVDERLRGWIHRGGTRRGRAATSASDAVAGKWGVRVHQTQEMKGKEGTGDPGGQDAKSGRYSPGSGLRPSGEKCFFADVPLHFPFSSFREVAFGSEHGRPVSSVRDSAPAVICLNSTHQLGLVLYLSVIRERLGFAGPLSQSLPGLIRVISSFVAYFLEQFRTIKMNYFHLPTRFSFS